MSAVYTEDVCRGLYGPRPPRMACVDGVFGGRVAGPADVAATQLVPRGFADAPEPWLVAATVDGAVYLSILDETNPVCVGGPIISLERERGVSLPESLTHFGRVQLHAERPLLLCAAYGLEAAITVINIE